MRNGDYVAAFSYFQKAADYGYSKAQYNVGLCHEHGRGTPKDLGKVPDLLSVLGLSTMLHCREVTSRNE